MYCQMCGKKISDQARFCNYCGAPVNNTQPKAAPPAQSAQPGAAGNKNSGGHPLLTILVAAAVFFTVRTIAEKNVMKQPQAQPQPQAQTFQSAFEKGLGEGPKDNPTDTCYLGALYQNGILTYGSARVDLSGYSLLPGEDGDWLISPDEKKYFSVSQQPEVNISYDSSDAESILKSYTDAGVSDAGMYGFSKYKVDGYPVIRYIVGGTIDGVREYIGEIIVFPNESPTTTMRLMMQSIAAEGYDEINNVFDTLDISSSYALKIGDVPNTGISRINVK